MTEAEEELGPLPPLHVTDEHVMTSGDFTYTTYFATMPGAVAKCWKPRLNWENDAWKWFQQLPADTHRGVREVLVRASTSAPNLDKVWTDADIEDLEDTWNGGIADLGDPEAAFVIQYVSGYRRYRESLVTALKAQLGPSWTMYRAMSKDEWEEAQASAEITRPVSWTFSKQLALNWANLAAVKGKRVVAQAEITPDAVWMRGKPEEAELVLIANEVSPHGMVLVKDG
jgi:hypothetical protein